MLTVFALVVTVVTANHEMWDDELQHWGIVVESQTPIDIFYHLRYDSSPALWHLCLYPFAQFTQNPIWMQVLHVALATLAAGIFLWWSPFTRLQKALFLLGYFPLFEYAAISRHYVLGELLLFAFLALYPWGGKRAVWAGVVLFLQTQTSLFGFILAFACVLSMLAHYGIQRPEGRTESRWLPRTAITGLVIAAVGFVVSFLQLLQHPDSGVHRGWDFINLWRALQASTITWRSIVPIPTTGIEFWNTNVLDSFGMLNAARDLPSLFLQAFLSAVIFFGSIIWFWRRPQALVLFLTAILGCLAFFYLKKLGYLRHHGHIYLAWIGAVWLYGAPRMTAEETQVTAQAKSVGRGWRDHCLTVVLVLNVVAACFAINIELREPFSAAPAVAGWIRERGQADDVIIAPNSVAGYLERDAYILQNGRMGRFKYYNRPWIKYTESELAEVARRLQSEAKSDCIIVLDHPSGVELTGEELTMEAEFEAGILTDDRSMKVFRLK